MRKEAKDLLRTIRSDKEITKYGHTKSDILILEIQNGYLEKGPYRSAIMEIAPLLGKLPEKDFSALMYIIASIGLGEDGEVGEAIKQSGMMRDNLEEHLGKRAKVLQYFAEAKPPLFSLEELEAETEVRERHPWQWIDAVEAIDPEAARKEMVKQITGTGSLGPLYARIPYLTEEAPPEFLDSILNDIEGNVPKERLEKIKQKVTLHRAVAKKK